MKVFLSSTDREMGSTRKIVAKFLEATKVYEPIHMSDFGAQQSRAVDFCRKVVRDSDVYVGIIGLEYGSYIPEGRISYTEDEYDTAVKHKKPTIIVMKDNTDKTEIRDNQAAFRRKLKDSHIVGFFAKPIDAVMLVLKALNEQRTSHQPNNEKHVFVSYSRHDELLVSRLVEFVEATGIKCWYDVRDTKITPEWHNQIDEAMDSSQLGLVFLTPHSEHSSGVLHEASYFVENNIPSVILRSDPTIPIPPNLQSAFRLDFSQDEPEKLYLGVISALGDIRAY